MNPPPIGEALTVGWNAYKEKLVPVTLGVFCASLLALIPLVGGGLAFAGMMHVSLKALRGQEPTAADGFVGFNAAVDHIVMGLLQIVGLIACCLGVYVTQALFFQGSILILEKNLNWSDAKDRCLASFKDTWVAWTIFVLVVGLVGSLGAIACGIGIYFTLPIATIALAYAYEQTLGRTA